MTTKEEFLTLRPLHQPKSASRGCKVPEGIFGIQPHLNGMALVLGLKPFDVRRLQNIAAELVTRYKVQWSCKRIKAHAAMMSLLSQPVRCSTAAMGLNLQATTCLPL